MILRAARGHSQAGPQPIAISEIKAYLDMVDVTDVETRRKYIKLIQILDGVEMEHIAESIKAKK